MTDITIPREAEAAARVAWLESASDYNNLDDTINAACIAMLKAWPGMMHIIEGEPGRENAEIILPLPQEASDE